MAKIPIADQPQSGQESGATENAPELRGPFGITKADIDNLNAPQALAAIDRQVRADQEKHLRNLTYETGIVGPLHQPPIIMEAFVATHVTMQRDSDSRISRHVGITMMLARETEPKGLTEQGIHFAEISLHLPPEYAGKFCAGQRFWLTISPDVDN
jgi:hypothetical protein